jgi:phage virion morphogenesis protein
MGAAEMTNRLEALEDWAAGLLGQLEPASRNKLARSVGHELRRSQQSRIISQLNPDGSKFAPRRQRDLRGKQGRVKRTVKMFRKLRTTRYLKVRCSGTVISVGFTGRIARIARIHQYGLKDRPEPGAADVQYHERGILGFTDADYALIRDVLLKSLTN